MMSVDASHYQLKSLAKELLVRRGFDGKQIFTEVPIVEAGQTIRKYFMDSPHDLKVKRGIVADVIGFKGDHDVVLECGTTPTDRLAQLRLFFDEVLYMPFVNTVDHLTDVSRLETQIDQLRQENARLVAEVKKHQERLRLLDYNVRNALEK